MKIVKLIFILSFLFLTLVNCRLVTYIDTLEYWINTNYLNGSTRVDYENKDHSSYRVHVEGNVIKENVNSVIMNIQLIRVVKNPTTKMNETHKLIDVTFDVCANFRKRKGDTFTKYMIRFFNQFGRIPMSCPVKAGHYYLHNATLNGFDFPGRSLYNGHSQMKIKFQIWTKVSKALVTVMKGEINGGYKNM